MMSQLQQQHPPFKPAKPRISSTFGFKELCHLRPWQQAFPWVCLGDIKILHGQKEGIVHVFCLKPCTWPPRAASHRCVPSIESAARQA